MMRKLSSGEWRLLLLSDCIKYYKDIAEHTSSLRKEGKEAILSLNGDDTKELDNFIDEIDAKAIRGMLRKEWRFTGKVTDRGSYNMATCEYCQKQQIRYEYWCTSRVTGVQLALGSVCVGYVIHGEEAMKNKDFHDKFVGDLDRLKENSTPGDPTQNEYQDLRAEQFPEIQLYMNYLKGKGIDSSNSDFIKSLNQRWLNGKTFTDGQIEALKNMCKKIKYGSKATVEFKSLDAEIQYQKIMLKLQNDPDSEFYQACKLRIERHGELTPNMARALMGGS